MLQEEGRAIAEFWKSLWQVAGSYTPGHSSLAEWGRKVCRAVAEAGETEGPTLSQAWWAAVGKQPNLEGSGARCNSCLLVEGV